MFKLTLPHHSNKKRELEFKSIEEIESYIENNTGFVGKLRTVNIPIYYNDILLGRLGNTRKHYSFIDKDYRLNIEFNDDWNRVGDNSELWDVDEDSGYPSIESTFLSEYEILKHKDTNLYITIFKFHNHKYYFDYLDLITDSEIMNAIWHKYEEEMY